MYTVRQTIILNYYYHFTAMNNSNLFHDITDFCGPLWWWWSQHLVMVISSSRVEYTCGVQRVAAMIDFLSILFHSHLIAQFYRLEQVSLSGTEFAHSSSSLYAFFLVGAYPLSRCYSVAPFQVWLSSVIHLGPVSWLAFILLLSSCSLV